MSQAFMRFLAGPGMTN